MIRLSNCANGRPRDVGVGLRAEHYAEILGGRPEIPWLEALTENYFGLRGDGGRPLEKLLAIRRDYPIVLHGVSLSIGGTDPLDPAYLDRWRALIDRTEPAWVSDHLCWTEVEGTNLHDLMPLPFTEETLAHVSSRVFAVQDFLGREIALENVSSYLTFSHSDMTEWEFLSELAARTGCRILLDVNNVFVSATNHGFRAVDYLEGIPVDAVVQFHLGGYSDAGTHLVDTHDHPVWDPVWDLFRVAVRRFGDVPTSIEWDADVPALDVLLDEAAKASAILEENGQQTRSSRAAAVAEVAGYQP